MNTQVYVKPRAPTSPLELLFGIVALCAIAVLILTCGGCGLSSLYKSRGGTPPAVSATARDT